MAAQLPKLPNTCWVADVAEAIHDLWFLLGNGWVVEQNGLQSHEKLSESRLECLAFGRAILLFDVFVRGYTRTCTLASHGATKTTIMLVWAIPQKPSCRFPCLAL